MNRVICLAVCALSIFTACDKNEPDLPDNGIPVVKAESTYSVIVDEDITYASGLSHDETSPSNFPISLYLDVYYPDNESENRPVYMFIHGGGFQGGTKTKPEIIDMAEYFASRGWVFASIDYRTTEDFGTDFTGIAPEEWIEFVLENAMTPDEGRTGLAMYTAQRDAKAALRWLVANISTYKINRHFITVGGASAGAITTLALGISNEENFKDEIPLTDDPTLSGTNPDETFTVKSMINFWGANAKLELFEAIYGVSLYDSNDPELFTAHGTLDVNPATLFTEATEISGIYDSLGIYNELVPLEGEGHGAWTATVNGKSLSDMSFDFLVERQNLNVE